MGKKRFSHILAVLVALLMVFVLLPCGGWAQTDTLKTVKIFHTNDVHGYADASQSAIGYARFKSYMDAQQADIKLTLDAGDAYHGQNIATLTKGESIARIMRAVGYDQMALGNHDFNYGQQQLGRLLSDTAINGLAVNIKRDGEYAYGSYATQVEAGVTFGFVGVTTPDTASATDPKNVQGLDFGTAESIQKEVQTVVDELREDGASIVIAITHLGTNAASSTTSMDLARGVEGIDLIVDGHSHTYYENGYTDYPGYIQGRTPMIVSTGAFFAHFGIVTMQVNDDGEIVSLQADSRSVEDMQDVQPDPTVQGIIDEINREQQGILQEVVTSSPVFLNGAREYVRSQDTNLSRMVTTVLQQTAQTDIAILNGGSLRASIPAGEVTKGDILNVMPFGNYIVKTTLTGQEIWDNLDSHMAYGEGKFTQFAGMEVVAKRQEQNGGIYARVQSITIDGQPIDLNKTYTVATIDYLTGGGDGYSFSHPIIGEYGTMSDAVIEYMNTVSEQQMHAFSRSRLTILEDSLSETVLLAKANVQVPDALYTHLTKPDVLPQSVVRAMQGQRRSLIFDVDTQGETIRWAWDCAALENPMDVDLTVELSDTTNNPALQALTKDCAPLFIGLNAQQLPGETALRIPWTSDAPYFYRIDGDSAIQVGAVEAVDGWATLLLARGGEYLLTKTAISGGASPQPTQSLAPSASPQNGGDVPKTGDDQDAALPIACMAGAMALAAAGVLVYRKRLSHRGNGA